jgi:hypothetical protein
MIQIPNKLTIMELISAFIGARRDHPGRKDGCPHRRGCFHGKITRQRQKK